MKKEIFEAPLFVEAKEQAFKEMNMKEEDLIIRTREKSEKENSNFSGNSFGYNTWYFGVLIY